MQAFSGCASLANVTMSNGVSSIGVEAFQSCGLTSVTVPGTVTNMGDSAFSACTALASLTLANGVTSIGEYAFEGCTNLTRVAIPGSVTNFGSDAFESCTALASVTLGYGITNIPPDAFGSCAKLASVTIPDSVTTIEMQAFAGCRSLTNIVIPASVTNIISFGEAGLISIYFLGNAPTVSYDGFGGDSGATAYYLPGTTNWAEFTYNAMIPALEWNALIPASGANFGVRSNQFGFTITGTANIPIVVEASGDLSGSAWTPLLTLTLTNGSYYFSEPLQTNGTGRFYRISSP
jgi:hypothetical protein